MADFSEADLAAAIAASLADGPPPEQDLPEQTLLPPDEVKRLCAQLQADAQDALEAEGCDECEEGCGRYSNGRWRTCCKSCVFLRQKKGIVGHDIACDVRHNSGTAPPWYWRSSRQWPRDFHEEIGGEYVKKMGSNLLQVSMPGHEVVECVRVEDSLLWSRYCTKRADIRQRAVRIEDIRPETSRHIEYSAKTTLDGDVNEVWLFHGTDEAAAKGIARSNFRVPKGVGGVFGPGAYFADASAKSDGYAEADDDGIKTMLLCRVVLGNVFNVEGEDRRGHHRVRDEHYDSVSGFTNHREFIVYDMCQIYPEYIMKYHCAT